MRATGEHGAALGTEAVREAGRLAALLLVAEAALERRAEPVLPALGLEDPVPREERRLVTHVLAMAAGELGDPVALLVLLVSDDRALHPLRVRPPGLARLEL
jgi:hypothetical protein